MRTMNNKSVHGERCGDSVGGPSSKQQGKSLHHCNRRPVCPCSAKAPLRSYHLMHPSRFKHHRRGNNQDSEQRVQLTSARLHQWKRSGEQPGSTLTALAGRLPLFLFSPARLTVTNWTDSISLRGRRPAHRGALIGPRRGVVRQRAAPLVPLRACLVAASVLAPTDLSNGRLKEMMLLLCFGEVLHPCYHAPPFFFFQDTSHYTGSNGCRRCCSPSSSLCCWNQRG